MYGLTWLTQRRGNRLSLAYRHALFWGGLRGAISLALALSLPFTLAEWELLRVMAFGVVLFTLLVQGTTMQVLLRRLDDSAGERHHFRRRVRRVNNRS